ncbi:nicotinate phosphoribosyltransferase, (NAPRTase) family, partial [Ostertagia ostertagi]
MLWRTLCEDTAAYEFPVLAQNYFEKLVLIWKTQSQSVNRRLVGSVPVGMDAEEYNAIIQNAAKIADCYVGQECEVRRFVAKDASFSNSTYEVSFAEDELSVVFVPVQLDQKNEKSVHISFPYKLSCVQSSDSSLRLTLAVPMSISDCDCRWLLNNMFPALFKWLRFIDPNRVVRKTNALLDIENYNIRYRKIKENYGRQLVETWTERTDPKKFVYEDCGIAAYLLEFWRKRGRTPKKFADLGCGNGLLVYLLNKEGIDGVGIDIRKRKIWSEQLAGTSLIEAVVDPSKKDTAIPNDVDYLIGNHTDELTPWMPVMAARMNCDFFVLPCCPFNFNGKYVARPGDSGSQYDSFLRFVREVCARLGFIVEEDRLSIPSTKRLCYVCTIPPQGLVPNVEDIIEELTGSSTKVFLPRSKVEQVRNCLNVPKDVRLDLTKRFFFKLLEMNDEVQNGWRRGGTIELGKLAVLLTPEEKQLMKQQCGGLQTFLRNQHQVFKVCARLGFIVEEDRLSIPSTKRLCYVCTIPPQGLVPNVEDIIEELTGSSTKVFLPRSKVEQVRNCLNVPKDVRLDLTKRFFFKLLEMNDEVQNGWRRGGTIELGKLAVLLTPEEKQLMKQQCGGLQTFLRNQHQVFKVTGGMAQIRDWREDASRKFRKSKGASARNGISPCWMAEYHPDGCPMKDMLNMSELVENVLYLADSYKLTHHNQYPEGTTHVYSYFESRGGKFPEVCFFGLQYILKRWLVGPVVTHEMIDEAKAFYNLHFKLDVFNESGWRHIVDNHGGCLPLRIKAVPEGKCYSPGADMVSYDEAYKQLIARFLHITSDSMKGLPFKLHDFGYRGSTSVEESGAAHLVNFMGTDTIAGLQLCRKYYSCEMAGFSIPATEHSTITTWKREGEVAAFRNMLQQYPKGSISVVSDSYDVFHAVSSIWGEELREEVIERGKRGCLVIRPDPRL